MLTEKQAELRMGNTSQHGPTVSLKQLRMPMQRPQMPLHPNRQRQQRPRQLALLSLQVWSEVSSFCRPNCRPLLTILGQTVIVTKSPEATNSTSSSGPNVAGIAAGVVVGVVVIAAAIGGMWFYLRARNRRELEDAHRRQAAINAFVKSPSDAPAFDTRLEPAIMRRMSAGSIADNQDYSRRILKVCAPPHQDRGHVLIMYRSRTHNPHHCRAVAGQALRLTTMTLYFSCNRMRPSFPNRPARV